MAWRAANSAGRVGGGERGDEEADASFWWPRGFVGLFDNVQMFGRCFSSIQATAARPRDHGCGAMQPHYRACGVLSRAEEGLAAPRLSTL